MPKPFAKKRHLLLAALLLVGAIAFYVGLLTCPGPFFAYYLRHGPLTVYSDEPIPAGAVQVLAQAIDRVTASPLYRLSSARRVYVCNRPWRFALFANLRYHVGGLAYPPLSNNIFLRAAHFDANRLVGPSGAEVPGERTLSYFIAHEVAHTLIAERLGGGAYWRLPAWKNEGYSDYLAKGPGFRFDEAARQLRQGDPEMDPARSGLYLRYHLLVSFLLDEKGLSVTELFETDFDTRELEREIKRQRP
jgi:hypothetical protein